ncbi:MAG: hypothetical protein WB987_10070 [Candidatus Acidiferrales bacterium]
MWQAIKQGSLIFSMAAILVLSVAGGANAQASLTIKTGAFADGATYLIEVPSNWNGTLFLYSHGYVVPGSPNPATDVGDPFTRGFLLANGFALAGSSYAHTGWAIQEALTDQIAVLDTFNELFGKPTSTIAWGHSLGGIITAGLIQNNPKRFTAAQPMCGVLAGGVATWNTALDAEFAFKTLLAPASGLQLVNITNPAANLTLSEQILTVAQQTPQGRARIALAAALGDTPGWFTPTSPEPARNDFTSQEANQFLWDEEVDFPFVFAFRAELEARAGGNVSWNTGVDYRVQLAKSANLLEVWALYQTAGLSLEGDLETLNRAARIKANPSSVDYLERDIIFNGRIGIPVLSMHTTGDGLVVDENETAYRTIVDLNGNGRLLRQTFISRAGHCSFTPAETIAAVGTLLTRVETGRWPSIEANLLNGDAAALGPTFNVFAIGGAVVPVAPAFVDTFPGLYPRPFDSFTALCAPHGNGNGCGFGFLFLQPH